MLYGIGLMVQVFVIGDTILIIYLLALLTSFLAVVVELCGALAA